MKYNNLNDNELLYLISLHDDDALEILIDKYHPLIESRIKRFNIKYYNHDDFYQECIFALYNCVKKFRDDKNGIFNIYLDNAIQNKIKYILKRESEYFYNVTLVEDLEYVESNRGENNLIYKIKEPILGMLSSFEKEVYIKYFEDKLAPRDISCMMVCEDKKVYNALVRIRQKLKNRNLFKNDEKFLFVKDNLYSLSGLEYKVLKLYSGGHKIYDIAYELNMEYNQVANALARAKNKMKK